MINRRDFVLAALGMAVAPGAVAAVNRAGNNLVWADYCDEILQLALAYLEGAIPQPDMAARGVQLLQRLNTSDDAFQAAVQTSWESGNRYWLWQRLTKETGVTGGILTIDHKHAVPMHDHPGATGMIRVLKGEVEVWQYDCSEPSTTDGHAILDLMSHRILRPGDIAVLSPERGNIHALHAQSKSCHMLDYFIPPYRREKRTWYQPLNNGWHDKDQVICRSISENEFYMS